MKKTIFILLLTILLAGCKTKTTVVTVPEVRTDTTYITKMQRDSIFVHDSIHVKEKQTGDTVWLELERWHTHYIDRTRHDTIYHATHDTIPAPYPVTEYVEKSLSWWQRTRLALGNMMLILLAASVIYAAWRLYMKFHLM